MNNNLYQKLYDSFCKYKKNNFLKTSNQEKYSYNEVIIKTNLYSTVLKELGLKKGQRLLIQTNKNIETIWIYLATLKLGAIYVPINVSYTSSELEYFINDSEPKIFVTDNFKKIIEITNKYPEIYIFDLKNEKKLIFNKTFNVNDEITNCNNNDTAAILYTSGTTGKPKGAMISNQNLISNCLSLIDLWQISEKDVLLHILPIYHTHGLFVALNTLMMSGGSIKFFEKFDENDLIKSFNEGTIMMGVPTHYIRLLNYIKSNIDIKNFRLFISGSAPLSSNVHNEFFKKTGFKILERYGMTETNMLTSNPYNGERKAGTVGLPLPNVEIRIRDLKTNKIVSKRKNGIIEVRGPNVFKSYWKKEVEAKKEFTEDNFFITGDLGFFDEDGYLNISGRDKDLIISGGLNVYPAEIEKVIDEFDEIKESAVIGLPHEDFGEGVTALITLKKNINIEVDYLKSQMKKKLAGFKIPQQFIILNELPKNVMGKVKKNELRKKYKKTYFKDSNHSK